MAGDIHWLTAILVGGASAGVVKAIELGVSFLFDKRRVREAQRDADAAIIEKVAFEVRDLALAYWATSGKDQKAEGAISGRLLFVGSTVEELLKPSSNEDLWDAQVALNRFDVACTGGDFGSVGREPNLGNSATIEHAAYNLVHLICKFRRRL